MQTGHAGIAVHTVCAQLEACAFHSAEELVSQTRICTASLVVSPHSTILVCTLPSHRRSPHMCIVSVQHCTMCTMCACHATTVRRTSSSQKRPPAGPLRSVQAMHMTSACPAPAVHHAHAASEHAWLCPRPPPATVLVHLHVKVHM